MIHERIEVYGKIRFRTYGKDTKNFIQGKEDVLAVKDEALSVLRDAKQRGNQEILREVEDMLMEFESSIEEKKCKCHRKDSIC